MHYTCVGIICIGGVNNFINVHFNLTGRTFICTFDDHNQPPGVKYCNASISYGSNCRIFLGVYVGSSTSNVVTTAPLDLFADNTEYCYNITVTALNKNVNHIMVEGVLNLLTLSASNGNHVAL